MRILAVATVALAVTAGSAHAAVLGVETPAVAVFNTPATGQLFDAPEASQVSIFLAPGLGSNRYSGLPDPSVWSMLILGFGAAGSAMRRQPRQATYRLEECAPEGLILTEEFVAPNDASALSRAASVVSGDFKLWRGDVLVQG